MGTRKREFRCHKLMYYNHLTTNGQRSPGTIKYTFCHANLAHASSISSVSGDKDVTDDIPLAELR
jgi:hypothetical protein